MDDADMQALSCREGCRFPVVCGVAVMLPRTPFRATHENALASIREAAHLTGGEFSWRYGVDHLQPANAYFAMHWATLPFRWHPPVFPAVPADVLVVLDEAYNEYLPPEFKSETVKWLKRHPNLIVSRTFSKAYGLAGLRVGYAFAHASVADIMNRVRQPFNVNSIGLAAAAAALDDMEFVARSFAENLQGLRQVPVVEGAPGVQAAFEHGVDQAVVEGQAGLVHGAKAKTPLRQDARPGDGEAVGVDAQRGDQVEVAVQAVVVVAGDVAVARVGDGAGLLAEAVPDGFALAVGEGRALDLGGGGGDAEDEVGGEGAGVGQGGHGRN